MKRSTLYALAASFAAAFAPTTAQFAAAQDTCRSGYVWREAFPRDRVCVTPETRAQAAQDNSQATARRQPGGGPSGPNTCLQGYVWREAGPNDLVCVQRRVWEGAARSLDCSKDTLSMSKRVVLQPNETQEVKFLTPNCGNKARPSFRPNIVRSTRID